MFLSMNAGKNIYITINKNGTYIATEADYSCSAGSNRLELSSDVYLNGDADYIEIHCYNGDTGNDRNISGTIAGTNMTIHRFA